MEGICPRCRANYRPHSGLPDPCFGGYLTGVAWACCGHGDDSQAYVVFGDHPDQGCEGRIFAGARGRAALLYFESVT